MKISVLPLFEQQQEPPAEPTERRTIELDYEDAIQKNPKTFINLLDQYKALIIKKQKSSDNPASDKNDYNNVFDVNGFGQFVTDLQLVYYPYIGGAAPRSVIPVNVISPSSNSDGNDANDIVFTANESPPDQPIPFHHELAQTENPPNYIFFYCDTPVAVGCGGETPIIDSTAVYRFVKETHPSFLSKLQQHGVRYIRTLPSQTDPLSPIGRSYKETYNVTNRTELEDKLKQMEGYTWEWIKDDKDDDNASVRITSGPVPAIRLVSDQSTNNYVFQYTFSNSIIAAYLGWQDCRNDRHDALRYGDMTVMDESVLQSIASFMQTNRILYTWEKGDIMAINNQLVMHSRNPFQGTRKVLASIWGPLQPSVLYQQPENGVAIGQRVQYQPIQPSDPLVFGFWKVPTNVCADVCYNAIKCGYRRLDCACDYGNEVQVGMGIAKALQDNLCTREELFITSKLWNTYHKREHVPMALHRTLQDLQLTFLDEYLIHFPMSMEYVPIDKKYPPEWTNLDGNMVLVPIDIIGETWTAMEQLVDDGLCRTIGVCNFATPILRQLLSCCRIRPSTLQIEVHPQNAQPKLIQFALDAGIQVTAFSVFGASSYVELNMASERDIVMKDPAIQAIARHHKKTPAQILIRWAIQRNIKPLCKTSHIQRMEENRDVFDFYLTNHEMEQILSLNLNKRYNDPGVFCQAAFGTFCPIYD